MSFAVPLFFLENFFLQFFIVYIHYLFIINNSAYYILLFIFLEIILFGLFICYYQLELFTGFLWVTEFTIIFIAIILLFYLNVSGLNLKYNNINALYYIPLMFILSLLFSFDLYFELELISYTRFNFLVDSDDYYLSINNYIMNDFLPLKLSYYLVNSIEFIIIGLLLLNGSVACVNLYKSNKSYLIMKQDSLFNVFNFFIDCINFSFLKKQNLNYQTNYIPNIRLFKKKDLSLWFKKKLT